MKVDTANVIIADAIITPSMLSVIRTWQSSTTGAKNDEPIQWYLDTLSTVTDCILDPERIDEMTDKDRLNLLTYVLAIKQALATFSIYNK